MLCFAFHITPQSYMIKLVYINKFTFYLHIDENINISEAVRQGVRAGVRLALKQQKRDHKYALPQSGSESGSENEIVYENERIGRDTSRPVKGQPEGSSRRVNENENYRERGTSQIKKQNKITPSWGTRDEPVRVTDISAGPTGLLHARGNGTGADKKYNSEGMI